MDRKWQLQKAYPINYSIEFKMKWKWCRNDLPFNFANESNGFQYERYPNMVLFHSTNIIKYTLTLNVNRMAYTDTHAKRAIATKRLNNRSICAITQIRWIFFSFSQIVFSSNFYFLIYFFYCSLCCYQIFESRLRIMLFRV